MVTAKKVGLGVALGLAAALGVLGSGGCRSLSKPKLETRLRALKKNASVGPLRRTELEVEGETRSFELVYLHEPALREGGTVDPTPVVLVHGTPSTLFS